MPLLDHFHPPLSERRPLAPFHANWCGTLADHLNHGLLPAGYVALEIDVVTTRQANLHNELIDLLDADNSLRLPPASALYAVAYRPLCRGPQEWVEAWPTPLALGEMLPTVPLSLSAECCVAVDLEAAYRDACRRRRVEEAAG